MDKCLMYALPQPVSVEEPTWVERGRIPCLDGLRGIAIVLVILSHTAGTKGAKLPLPLRYVGGLGVEIFFVISGFLITLLLLREMRATGKISLKHFYMRRSLRILPAYFAYLGGLALMQSARQVRIPFGDWFGALTYTINLRPHPANT
jgi:peptidoglycan/LPS O-acetylase OafA/YrhL